MEAKMTTILKAESNEKDIKYIQALLDTKADNLDKYVTLHEYKNKYASDVNAWNTLFNEQPDSEWAKSLFIKDDGLVKTKKEVIKEMNNLNLGVEHMYMEHPLHGSNLSIRKANISNQINRAVQLLGLPSKTTSLSISQFVNDHKNDLEEILKNLQQKKQIKTKKSNHKI
jgi:hypothetical protein